MLSPDGKTLVNLPIVWDVGLRQDRARFPTAGFQGAFSADSQRVAYWGHPGSESEVVIADASNGNTLTVLNPGNVTEFLGLRPSCAAFSNDGNQVAIGTIDGPVILQTIADSTPTSGSSAAPASSESPR